MVMSITILMAVYNSPITMLDQAIDSLLAQTFRAFELLIVDDGSSDDTLRAHLQRRSREDSRIRVAWEPHRGLTASLNRGIVLCQTELIARHDADDWSSSERLERQYAHFVRYPDLALCGTNVWTHQQNGRPLWSTRLAQSRQKLLAAFPEGNPFVHGATMFRRTAALTVGGYREAFHCSQDYDFFWRLAERYEASNLPEPLYHYRYTSGSISSNRVVEQLQAHNAIRELARRRARGEPEDPVLELARAASEMQSPSKMARVAMKQADHVMLAGNYRNAAQAYLELLRAHPTSPLAWAKLARLGIFRTMPFLREACF